MVNILVKNDFILTMNGSQLIIMDGALAIENDKIVEVGKSCDLPRVTKQNGPTDRVYRKRQEGRRDYR